uniref:Uncharacterized protein n=1 Tax=Romanomermis culicivorax TaxID=13658 RepID=A0A915L7H3_ROMCU
MNVFFASLSHSNSSLLANSWTKFSFKASTNDSNSNFKAANCLSCFAQPVLQIVVGLAVLTVGDARRRQTVRVTVGVETINQRYILQIEEG